jgi:release factor glutamine methyltransferase
VNLKQALLNARDILARSSIDDASLEAEILLRHTLKISSAQLYQGLDTQISKTDESKYYRLVERRRQGEPTAYITGHREFYGLDFSVDHNVLIPRPESEFLVEKALEIASRRDITTIVDVGTGCGAIAISLAMNLTGIKIYAVDISLSALEVARRNCRRLGIEDKIEFLHGNMLEPLPGPVDLIVANLPYVRESEIPERGPLSFEPVLALNGGLDGTSMIGTLCNQAAGKLAPGGCVLLEIGEGQADAVTDIVREAYSSARIETTVDYAGIVRVVGVYLTPSRA